MLHRDRLLPVLVLTTLLAMSAAWAAAPAPAAPLHDGGMGQSMMMTMSRATPLTEPGNGAFGAIQEAVRALQADPHTDWSRVNLEVLREHLVDMRNMTLDVTVHAQKPIPDGVEIRVSGNTAAADASLGRVLAEHPAFLAMETGWKMKVAKRGGVYDLVVTTRQPGQVAEIRGLGYIGLLALGNHHQVHHWQMATGNYRPLATSPRSERPSRSK